MIGLKYLHMLFAATRPPREGVTEESFGILYEHGKKKEKGAMLQMDFDPRLDT